MIPAEANFGRSEVGEGGCDATVVPYESAVKSWQTLESIVRPCNPWVWTTPLPPGPSLDPY